MKNNIPNLEMVKAMLENDELEAAEDAINKFEAIIKQAAPDAADELDDDCEDDGEDCENDEEDDGTVQKLGPPPGGVKWPKDDLMDAMTEGRRNLGRDAPVTTHPTEFDNVLAEIMASNPDLSRTAALQQARLQRPSAFAAWNRARQTLYPKPLYKESAPAAPLTWEDAVQDEINKGCGDNQTVAEQRVQHQFGNLLPRRADDMAKAADTIVTKFMRQVDQTMIDEFVDRTTAMRKVREQQPDLYEAFQLV